MSDEGVKHLFVDFGKLKENEKRNKQGTGLGLSICK
jgi:signal transduction histidine kinase